jgi:hypothetical protein
MMQKKVLVILFIIVSILSCNSSVKIGKGQSMIIFKSKGGPISRRGDLLLIKQDSSYCYIAGGISLFYSEGKVVINNNKSAIYFYPKKVPSRFTGKNRLDTMWVDISQHSAKIISSKVIEYNRKRFYLDTKM